MSKCIGCGITLQNKDTKKLGYTKNLTNKYCERCFKTIHYNEERKVENPNNIDIINKINKLGLFTIFITDLLSINEKLISIFKSIDNEKVLIINKCDIIPDNLKLEYLEENIKTVYKIPCDVMFISAKKKLYLNSIIDLIEKHNEVIFCGETSSGKSTLINNLIDSNLTTSKYSNTTLSFIKLKKDNYVIYDTPGLFINDVISYDKINVIIKKLSNDFTLTIDNLKLRGSGNLTCITSDNINISSKKEDVVLNNKLEVFKPTDIILLNKGFIFVKNKANINSNNKLDIRNSILKN